MNLVCSSVSARPRTVPAPRAGQAARLVSGLSLALLAALAGCDTPTGTDPADLGPGPDMTVPPTRFGFVRAGGSSVTAGTSASTESMASALFIDTAATASGCSRTVVGECTMYRCTGTGFRYPAAGDIQVKPSTGTGFTLSPTADGYYVEQNNTSALLFGAGQAISLSAPGKEVPGFTADLTMPSSSFTISSPNAGRNNLGWIIPKATDFQVDWSSNASRVVIELTQGTGQAFGGVTIRCGFAGSAGTGKVPASLMANLKPTVGAANPARILLGPVVSKEVQSMGWVIEAMAVGVGRSGDVTIQ